MILKNWNFKLDYYVLFVILKRIMKRLYTKIHLKKDRITFDFVYSFSCQMPSIPLYFYSVKQIFWCFH